MVRRPSCGRVWQPWANGRGMIGRNRKSRQDLHCSPRSICPTAPAAQDLPVVAEIWYQQLKEAKEIVSPEYDPIRIQTGFKVLQAAETWPQPAELRRNLPPRLIPRAMLAKPAPDKEKGRQKMAEVKDVLNKKGK